jgi:hypothetical protein
MMIPLGEIRLDNLFGDFFARMELPLIRQANVGDICEFHRR